MANCEALRLGLKLVEEAATRGEWNQAIWWCGTSGCFAGHVVTHAGGTWVGNYDALKATDEEIKDARYYYSQHHHECLVDVAQRAEEILGITPVEADVLFNAQNTLQHLRKMVDALCDGTFQQEI